MSAKRTTTKEEEDKIVELYTSGISLTKLYKEHKFSFYTVRRVLRERGIQTEESKRRVVLNDEEIKLMIRLYQDGATLDYISKRIGHSEPVIRRELQENNVPERVPTEKKKARKIEDIIPGDPIDCNTEGKKCIYRYNNSVFLCNYCEMVGHSRGGDPHACTKYEFTGRRARKSEKTKK